MMALFRQPSATDSRYHMIDLLRGLAATAVLFWHYQHFFVVDPGTVAPAKSVMREPLLNLFYPLYRHGDLAVQIFWTISGFIFAAVYIGRHVDTRDFIVARFARLYPLHAITLVAVTVLQFVSISRSGTTLIYSNFDLYHFVLNFGFASAWGLERGFSFNGPIWSVSIEVLIYTLFWITRSWLFRYGVVGPGIACAVFMTGIVTHLPGLLWQCGFYFFAGTAIYVFDSAGSWLQRLIIIGGLCVGASIVFRATPGLALAALIIALVMMIAGLEARFASVGRRLRWLGDNTYSLYLWHVPVQMLILLVVVDRTIFLSPLFLASYIAGLMALARVSFLTIERPARIFLRIRLAGMPRPARS